MSSIKNNRKFVSSDIISARRIDVKSTRPSGFLPPRELTSEFVSLPSVIFIKSRIYIHGIQSIKERYIDDAKVDILC